MDILVTRKQLAGLLVGITLAACGGPAQDAELVDSQESLWTVTELERDCDEIALVSLTLTSCAECAAVLSDAQVTTCVNKFKTRLRNKITNGANSVTSGWVCFDDGNDADDNDCTADDGAVEDTSGRRYTADRTVSHIEFDIDHDRVSALDRPVLEVVPDVPTIPYQPTSDDITTSIFAPGNSFTKDRRVAAKFDGYETIQYCNHYRYWRYYDYYQFTLQVAEEHANADPMAAAALAFGRGGIGRKLARGVAPKSKSGATLDAFSTIKYPFSARLFATSITYRTEYYNLTPDEKATIQSLSPRAYQMIRTDGDERTANRILAFTHPDNKWSHHKDMYQALKNEPFEILEHYYNQRKRFVALRDLWRATIKEFGVAAHAENPGAYAWDFEDYSSRSVYCESYAGSDTNTLCVALEELDQAMVSALFTAKQDGCVGHNDSAYNTCDWSPQDFFDDLGYAFEKLTTEALSSCQSADAGPQRVNEAIAAGNNIEIPVCFNSEPGTLSLDPGYLAGRIRSASLFAHYLDGTREYKIDYYQCMAASGDLPQVNEQEAESDNRGTENRFKVCFDRDMNTSFTDGNLSDITEPEDLSPTVSFEFKVKASFKKGCDTSKGASTPLSIDWTKKKNGRGTKSCESGGVRLDYCNSARSVGPPPITVRFVIAAIPVYGEFGISGKAGLDISQPNPCGNRDSCVGTAVTVEPYVDIKGKGEVGVGLKPVASVGIATNVRLIRFGVPNTISLMGYKVGSTIKLKTSLDSKLDMKTLDGSVSLKATVFFKHFKKKLFSWSGFHKEVTIFDKSWEMNLLELQEIEAFMSENGI